MTESSRRAVLLARPGAACERLRSALADAGAQLVLEGDPTKLEPAALGAAAPQVVVVALDPVTEDVIERFDPVLADPAVEVIYEEASLAATREGWDLARWARHLVAKLQGHGDVLPPGHEPEGEGEDPAIEATAVTGAPPVTAAATHSPEAAKAPQAAPVTPPPAPTPREVAYSPFDPVAAEMEMDYAEPVIASEPPMLAAQELTAIEMPLLDEQALVSADADELVIEPFESNFDYEIAPVAAASIHEPAAHEFVLNEFAPREPAVSAPVDAPVRMFEASRELAAGDAADAKPAAKTPLAPDWSFADDNTGAAASIDSRAVAHKFERDLGDLETRISTLELVEDRPTVHNNGAVLVLAGIGGPDAVRQLLSGLPETFPRPVLVQQRLDGGRYDRLVAQMQRATSLQVRLAEPGLIAMAGVIYILPAVIGLSVSEAGMRFTDEDGDVLAALPSADSAVLLLSGSDPARVDAAMNHSWAGALVAGQAPDGCYDAAASAALIARGGESGQPVDLAARLAARWR